jgi:hypothetical protein
MKWLWIYMLLFPLSVWAQNTFEQKSVPAGLISTGIQTFATNTHVSTQTISTTSGNYAFTHWTINGVRINDAHGQALHKVQFNLISNTVAIANYLDKSIDSDSDGIPDWSEIKTSGNLDQKASSDLDGDGFHLENEVRLGLNPSIKDNVTEGGISIRRSSKVFVNLGGARKLTIRSNPAGLISSQITYPEVNSTHYSPAINGLSNGYYFSHWEVNGLRQADSKGVGLSKTIQVMSVDKEIVAKYFKDDVDSDNDTIPDWYEWREFGHLSFNSTSDPDGDGFSVADERRFGLSAVIHDNITEGGISIRRSPKMIVNLGGASKVTLKSSPPGLIPSRITFPERNSTFTSSSLNGLSNGYYFSHWEINGVRQADPKGLALSKVTEVLNEDKQIIAKYYDQNLDSDSDAIPDWYELHEFGHVTHSGNSDPDADGFSLADERKFGLSSVIKDNIKEGGISLRRATKLSYVRDPNDSTDSDGDGLTDTQEILLGTNTRKADTDGDGFSDYQEGLDGTNPLLAASFRNVAPTRISSLHPLSVTENQPIGTIVGNLKGVDPNDQNGTGTYTFAMVPGNGSTDNAKFNLDPNGTLFTAQVFDFETLSISNATNQSIRVRVNDSENLYTETELIVSVLDIQENENKNGLIESNDISLKKMPFFENQPTGTQIGEFHATNPEHNISISYSLVVGNGSTHNSFFSVDDNGSLRTNFNFDYETNSLTYSILIRATDEYNTSVEKQFLLSLSNAYSPLLKTEIPQIENLQVFLSALVVQNTLNPITASGFHLSENPIFTTFTTIQSTELTNSSFLSQIPISTFKTGFKYFVRSFAQNAEGQSVGNIKSFINPDTSSKQEKWWESLPIHPDNWRTSSWFGSFRPYSNGWIYHQDLNWLYSYPDQTGNLWLWSSNHGWLWTGSGIYPHLYKNSRSKWLYFLKKKENRIYLYDYTSRTIK